MLRYLISSQIWLLISLILCLGRTYERSDPLRYSFGHFAWFEPSTYRLLTLGALGLSLVFAVLTVRTRKRPSRFVA